MVEVIWTEPAIAELDEIADYISVDNYEAARKLVKRVLEKVEKLVEFPDMGEKVQELEGREYRSLIVKPCRIYYRQEKDKVYIVFVRRFERRFEF